MANVLDHADRSLTPVPRHNGEAVMIPKRNKNDWSQGGNPGQFLLINKKELNIDGRYQRSQVSEKKVRDIARQWDWILFGVVLVVQRNDGSFWVFDGGHRTRASFYRDDIHMLPCMVYSVSSANSLDSLPGEAKAFLGKNLMTTNVKAVDKYKAAVVANDEIALKADKLLAEIGIVVSGKANNGKQIKCIKTLLIMLERDEVLAKRCLAFCFARSEGMPISSRVMRGIFCLCYHFSGRIDILEKYGEKLARHSQREIEVRIRQMCVECGKGGETAEALALLSLINKGCKNKLAW